MIGRTSIAVPGWTGALFAQSSASSRSAHSTRQNPPSCSFDSANGPSVTVGSPSEETLIVVSASSTGSQAISAPASVVSRSKAAQASIPCFISSGVAPSLLRSPTMKLSRYFIASSSVERLFAAFNLTTNGRAANRQLGENPPISALDRIRCYYEALNTGDVDLVASHFTDDAVHYYTRLGPHRGREIAENARWGVENVDGQWWLEHGIESGDEAVIEWTMTWRDPRSGEKRLNRGTEWFRLEDGKIAEVRAYHHGDKKNPRGDLLGFDHAGRGYTTMNDWKPPKKRAQT
jgi:ketosteroid isomerase-like protein